jgi:PAS domain S-box-containing protein
MSDETRRSRQDPSARPVAKADEALVGEITSAWRKATDAFAKSERRYGDLVEHSLGLICTHDLTGRLGSINPAAARSLGYEPDEGIGRNLVDFLAPETRHLFAGYLRRIRDHRQDAGLMRVIARDGRERVWMYRNVLVEEPDQSAYVVGHAVDITERIYAERALREKEQALRRAHDELETRVKERTFELEQANERLRVEIAERQHAEDLRERAFIQQRDTLNFLATISEGLAPVLRFDELLDVMRMLPVPFASDWVMVHVLGEDGAIASSAGSHVVPSRHAVLADLARVASGVLPANSIIRRVIDTARPVILTDDSDEVRAALVGIAGSGRLVQQLGTGGVAVLPLVADGGLKAALSLGAADGTRFTASGRIVVEDLVSRARLALDRIALYREAQEASRVKDEFLSTLSHELRTPLNAVYGWARILRTRQLDKKTAHAVEVIERNAEAQVRMIEDVLDISRIITGKLTLAMESVDVATVLRTTLDSVRPAMQAKRVRLEMRLAEDCPPVWADPNRLQQVFWNVLSNAVKFTGANGVVTVTLRPVNDWVEVEVADTGVGIRRDVLPFVFDRFRQGDSSTTRRHGGLGLGLAIVRQLVELHGGTVRADSAGESRGAVFTIRLPMDERSDATAADEQAETVASSLALPSLGGRTVLLVEDHEDARELVASVLATAGAEVVTAASAAEALDRLEQVTPDVLVADLGLPDEDGYALLRRIRAMTAFDAKALPAVALTAYARASDRERAMSAGFLAFIVKPVDPVALVKVIESVCETPR